MATAQQAADITQLTEDLWVGGDLSYDPDEEVEQIGEILGVGITHIIDLRIESEHTELWSELGVAYLHLGTDDADGHHIPSELFTHARDFAEDCWVGGGTLLVHCHMGVNRGPSVAYSILLDRGWGPWKAFDHIRACRPQAAIWYAEDALAAHHDEIGSTEDRKNRSLDSFVAHRDKAFPPEQQELVRHYIGQRHARTDAQYAAALAKLGAGEPAQLHVLATSPEDVRTCDLPGTERANPASNYEQRRHDEHSAPHPGSRQHGELGPHLRRSSREVDVPA